MAVKDYVEFVGLLKDILTIFALAVGAIWTYFNFLKGRMYKPKLELDVIGEYYKLEDKCFILVKASVSNVGLSSVDLIDKGSFINLYSYPKSNYVPVVHEAVWQEDFDAFPVFGSNNIIESKENIKYELLIPVGISSENFMSWKIELVVLSKTFLSKQIRWNVVSIIFKK